MRTNAFPSDKSDGTTQATLPTGNPVDIEGLIVQTVESDPSVGGAREGAVMAAVAQDIRRHGTEPDLSVIGAAIKRMVEDDRLIQRDDGLHLEAP